MAHLEVNTFLNSFISAVEPFYKNAEVLEIGSYDVNGSVRSNFKEVRKYIGVDLVPGPSVDIVTKGHLFRSETKFDIVLSVESFEHNSDWVETFNNMVNLVDDDGIVIFTCATTGRLEHGTYRTDPDSSPGTSSSDNSYYKNLNIKDFKTCINLDKPFIAYDFFVNNLTKDLYFYGLKGNKKLDADSLAGFFSNATKASTGARKKNNLYSYLKVRSFYILMWPLYSLLSDKSYQNLTYLIYKKLRGLANSLR